MVASSASLRTSTMSCCGCLLGSFVTSSISSRPCVKSRYNCFFRSSFKLSCHGRSGLCSCDSALRCEHESKGITASTANDIVNVSSGEEVYETQAMDRVWVELAASGSTAHGHTLRIRLVSSQHPAAQAAHPAGSLQGGSAPRKAEASQAT